MARADNKYQANSTIITRSIATTTPACPPRYPEQVGGLVFVDAGHSGVLERFGPRQTSTMTTAACLGTAAARLGILRLVDPFGLRRESPDRSAQDIAALYRVEPMATFCGVVRGLPTSAQELRAAPPLRSDVPLVVLTAGSRSSLVPPGFEALASEIRREWPDLHRRFSERSSRGTWRIVADSDHLIGNSRPHAVVAAVLEVLAQARANVSTPNLQLPTPKR